MRSLYASSSIRVTLGPSASRLTSVVELAHRRNPQWHRICNDKRMRKAIPQSNLIDYADRDASMQKTLVRLKELPVRSLRILILSATLRIGLRQRLMDPLTRAGEVEPVSVGRYNGRGGRSFSVRAPRVEPAFSRARSKIEAVMKIQDKRLTLRALHQLSLLSQLVIFIAPPHFTVDPKSRYNTGIKTRMAPQEDWRRDNNLVSK